MSFLKNTMHSKNTKNWAILNKKGYKNVKEKIWWQQTMKVVVGSAVQKHGFIFDYTKEHSVPQRDDSSDEADSFWFSAHYTESCNLKLLAHAEQADRHYLLITNWLQYFGFKVVMSLNLYLFKRHSYALFLVIQIDSWRKV